MPPDYLRYFFLLLFQWRRCWQLLAAVDCKCQVNTLVQPSPGKVAPLSATTAVQHHPHADRPGLASGPRRQKSTSWAVTAHREKSQFGEGMTRGGRQKPIFCYPGWSHWGMGWEQRQAVPPNCHVVLPRWYEQRLQEVLAPTAFYRVAQEPETGTAGTVCPWTETATASAPFC